MRRVYLDFNSTSPLDPRVLEAMSPFHTEFFALPSSVSAWGRACEEAVEDARGLVAQLLQAESDEIVFTSGGTESCNLALFGATLGRFSSFPTEGHVILTAIEHAAVWEAAKLQQKMGTQATVVPADRNGLVDPEAIRRALRPDTFLVSVNHASHETGTLQPVREIGQICRERELLFHVDACQTVGRLATHVETLEVDLLSLSGHKIQGPKGIGALFIRRGVPMNPWICGSPTESGVRPGMENVPGIIGLGQAAAIAAQERERVGAYQQELRARLENGLLRAIGDDLTIYGAEVDRLPNTTYLTFGSVRAMDFVQRLPEVAMATGLGCGVMQDGLTVAQKALGLDREQAKCAIRLSVGPETTTEEIDFAVERLLEAFESLRR